MVLLCLQHKIVGAHIVAMSLLEHHTYETDVHLIVAMPVLESRKYEEDVHLIEGEDISIANDGDSELVGSLLHQPPVSCPLVPLLHGAAMNGHCCCSCILQRCRHLQNAKCAHEPMLCLQYRPFNKPFHMSDSCSRLCPDAGGAPKVIPNTAYLTTACNNALHILKPDRNVLKPWSDACNLDFIM